MFECVHSGTYDIEFLGGNQLDHKSMSAILGVSQFSFIDI